MKRTWLTTGGALLLTCCCAQYGFGGELPDTNSKRTSRVIRKYGIDENGRSFEYSMPVSGAPHDTPAPSRSAPPRTAKQYGIDQNGRSFEYEEETAPRRTTTVVTAPYTVHPPAPTAPAVPHLVDRAAGAPPASANAARKGQEGEHTPFPSAPRKPVTASRRTAPQASGAPSVAKRDAPARIVAPASGSAVVSRRSPATTVAKASPSPAPGEFIVMVSAGGTPKNGRALRKELRKHGAQSVRSRVEREGKTVQRLLYARHRDRSRAYHDVAMLQGRGQKSYVISERGVHSVYCGSYYREERARAEQAIIAGMGIRVTISRDSVEEKRTYYMARGFRSQKAALKLAGILQQRGVAATVMRKDVTG